MTEHSFSPLDSRQALLNFREDSTASVYLFDLLETRFLIQRVAPIHLTDSLSSLFLVLNFDLHVNRCFNFGMQEGYAGCVCVACFLVHLAFSSVGWKLLWYLWCRFGMWGAQIWIKYFYWAANQCFWVSLRTSCHVVF